MIRGNIFKWTVTLILVPCLAWPPGLLAEVTSRPSSLSTRNFPFGSQALAEPLVMADNAKGAPAFDTRQQAKQLIGSIGPDLIEQIERVANLKFTRQEQEKLLADFKFYRDGLVPEFGNRLRNLEDLFSQMGFSSQDDRRHLLAMHHQRLGGGEQIHAIIEYWNSVTSAGLAVPLRELRTIIEDPVDSGVLLNHLRHAVEFQGFKELNAEEIKLINSKKFELVPMNALIRKALIRVRGFKPIVNYEDLFGRLIQSDQWTRKNKEAAVKERISRIREAMAKYLEAKKSKDDGPGAKGVTAMIPGLGDLVLKATRWLGWPDRSAAVITALLEAALFGGLFVGLGSYGIRANFDAAGVTLPILLAMAVLSALSLLYFRLAHEGQLYFRVGNKLEQLPRSPEEHEKDLNRILLFGIIFRVVFFVTALVFVHFDNGPFLTIAAATLVEGAVHAGYNFFTDGPLSMTSQTRASSLGSSESNSLARLPDNEVNRLIREDILAGEAIAYDPKQGMINYFRRHQGALEQAMHLQENLWSLPPKASDRLADFLMSPANHARLANGLGFLDQLLSDSDPILSSFRYVILLRRRAETFRSDFVAHAGRGSIYLPLDALTFGWDALKAPQASVNSNTFYDEVVDGLVWVLRHERFHLSKENGVVIAGHRYASQQEWEETTLWHGHYSRYLIERLHESASELPLEEALTRLALIAQEGSISTVMYGPPDLSNPNPPRWVMVPPYIERSLEMLRSHLRRRSGRASTPYRYSLRYLPQDRVDDLKRLTIIRQVAAVLAHLFGSVQVEMDSPDPLPMLAHLTESIKIEDGQKARTRSSNHRLRAA